MLREKIPSPIDVQRLVDVLTLENCWEIATHDGFLDSANCCLLHSLPPGFCAMLIRNFFADQLPFSAARAERTCFATIAAVRTRMMRAIAALAVARFTKEILKTRRSFFTKLRTSN